MPWCLVVATRHSSWGSSPENSAPQVVETSWVDTHAGFALTASPQKWHGGAFLGRHLYEVLLENKPCWLYFDLEFSRVENPNHEPHVVAEAFVELLNQFCDLRFGQLIDRSTLYDLDSTNSEKFSKHIIVKKLISKFASSTNLAFHSNGPSWLFCKTLHGICQGAT